MNRGELRAAILRSLDRVSAPTTENSDVDEWINQVIREDLCVDHNWAFMENVRDLSTTASTDLYDFTATATTFKDCRFIRFRRTTADDFNEMEELSERAMFIHFTEQSKGSPSVWARSGDKFRVRLIPDASTYTFRIHTWDYPAAFTADGDNNDLTNRYPKLVEYAVLSRAMLYYGEDERAQLWIQLYDREKAKAENNDKQRLAQSNLILKPSTRAGRPVAGLRRASRAMRNSAYDWI